MTRLAAPLAALALAGCYQVLGESPGREKMLSRSYVCTDTRRIPTQIRAIFLRHGSAVREHHPDPAFFSAAGEYGRSEFAVQFTNENAHLRLYTAGGVAVTVEERVIFREFAAAFAGCREARDTRDVGEL